MNQEFVEKLFEEPSQWGLRGDPFLWKELKHALANEQLPRNEKKFQQLLFQHFIKLTGKEVEQGMNIFIEGYSKGGMSGGMVSYDFWLETGFPLLVERFNNVNLNTNE